MKLIEEYYGKNVKKWVDIAKEIHKNRRKGGVISHLVKEFRLEDVRQIEHFIKFDAIERGYVWKRSSVLPPHLKTNPLHYVGVAVEAFLDGYNHSKNPNSYVWTHSNREEEERAVEEIHETVKIAREFNKTIDRLLSSSYMYSKEQERKIQYGNLVSGIYNNEITPQVTSQEAVELSEDCPQFKEDIYSIWKLSFGISSTFTKSHPRVTIEKISYFLETLSEDHVASHYKNKPQQKMIIEGLLVELRMMQTASKSAY